MKTIQLRNYKGQFIIFGILALGLALVLIYYAFGKQVSMSVSGAEIDTTTTNWLLIILSIPPLLASLIQFMLLISYVKYGDFVIILSDDRIEYPLKDFNSFSKITISKDKIKEVKFVLLPKQEKEIRFYNYKNQYIGNIPGDFAPLKTMKPEELYQVINEWVKSIK